MRKHESPASYQPEEPRNGMTRRPYQSPRLHRFGTLKTITSTVGKSGQMDGGSGMGSNKTA
jgi:hypothetical protein